MTKKSLLKPGLNLFLLSGPKYQKGARQVSKKGLVSTVLPPPRDRKWASAGVVMNDLAMEKTMNFSFVSCLLLRRVVFACVVVGFTGQVPSDEEGFCW